MDSFGIVSPRLRRATLLCVATLLLIIGCDRGTVRTEGGSKPLIVVASVWPPPLGWRGVAAGAASRIAARPIAELIVRDSLDSTQQGESGREPDVLAAYLGWRDADVLEPWRPIATRLLAISWRGLDVEADALIEIDYASGAVLLARALDDLVGERRTYAVLHAASRDAATRLIFESFRETRRGLLTPREIVAVDLHARGVGVQQGIDAVVAEYSSTRFFVVLDPSASATPLVIPDGAQIARLSAAPPLWDQLSRGALAAICGPNDGEIGRAVVDLSAALLSPEPTSASRRSVVPCRLVTAETLAAFREAYVAAVDE